MPIEVSTEIHAISQDEYHQIDRQVLGMAFEIHNEYGRLLDEEFYKSELKKRCSQIGMQVTREQLIRVRHGQFTKDYFIDLLFENSVIVECKCAQSITQAHRGQTLNYLQLRETNHGSLVNFRPFKVKREFVSSHLTHEIRRKFKVCGQNRDGGPAFQKLMEVAIAFCSDVGLGLDLTMYRQAFIALNGGPFIEPQIVPIFSGDEVVYEHSMSMLTQDIGLAVTALSTVAETRIHLQRLLRHTRLEGIAWVNLPLNEMRFEFLRQNHVG